jgi:hypothetical protein
MAARHRKAKKAEGGYVKPEVDSGEPKVIREAEERKKGGKVMKGLGKMEGEEPKHHMGRKKRASGGGVGSDSRPFSSAKRTSSARASDD